jgi:hypothetical protein
MYNTKMSNTKQKSDRMDCPICKANIKISYYAEHQKTQKHLRALESGLPSTSKSTTTRLEYFKEKNNERKKKNQKIFTPEQLRETQRIARQKSRLALKAKMEVKEEKEQKIFNPPEDDNEFVVHNIKDDRKQEKKSNNKNIESFLKELRYDLTQGIKKNNKNILDLKPIIKEKIAKVSKAVINESNCDTLKAAIKANSDVKAKTIDKHFRTLEILFKDMFPGKIYNCETFDWIQDTDGIYDFIMNKSKRWNTLASKKTALSTIAGFLRERGGHDELQKIYSKLKIPDMSLCDEINKDYKEERENI